MTKIYIDTCGWNRPFHDQTRTRVHLEAEAVLAVLSEMEKCRFQLLHSEAVDLEIANVPDINRRNRLLALIPRQHLYLHCNPGVYERAFELELKGFAGVDALHLALAESARADAFLTTDDRLLRRAAKHIGFLHVRVANPLAWMQTNFAD